jgi:hypothetical protein
MQTYLSFEPRYHELTCREGQPVWVPMYNPMRECVSQECLQLQAAGCEVETRLGRLPKTLRRAVARTKRRQQYAKWSPILEPVLTGVLTLSAIALFVQSSCLVGAALAIAFDPVGFEKLSLLKALVLSAAVGLPIVGGLFGVLHRSWRSCVISH